MQPCDGEMQPCDKKLRNNGVNYTELSDMSQMGGEICVRKCV